MTSRSTWRWATWGRSAVVAACAALVATGCGSVIAGKPVSMLYNPARVGGLPVTDGPSGPRDDAPEPTVTVENSDGGEIDHLAALSIDDIEDFWRNHYTGLGGSFEPVDKTISYDSTDRNGPRICGAKTYRFVNAFYCHKSNIMAWDRGVLRPAGKKYYGDMSITGTLAHEYGHAVQYMAGLVDKKTPTIVAEQQADCFAGVYLQNVAAGHSTRFTLSTTDGLNHILAGLINLRDPVLGPDDEEMIEGGHGTALDRISAFQMGFDSGTTACAATT